MKNNLSKIINKIASIFKKEIMLSVSLLAAIVSLFITPPQVKLLYDIDWKTLATLFMLLSVLEGFKKEQIFDPLLKITRKIGGITYLVGIHFNEGATETVGEKLKRMMKTECEGAKSV